MSHTIAMAGLLLTLSLSSLADGMMVPGISTWKKMRDEGLVKEPEQRALIVYSNGREDLIISPSYEGAANQFAWVIPVPSKPTVEAVDIALFDELRALLNPPPGSPSPGTGTVKALERRVVGGYDVSVLAADDSHALASWLSENGYHLPDSALPGIQYYVDRGWKFVACKIHDPVVSADGLRTGTLAPLRMSFASKRPVYPLKLSAANPGPFDLEIYLVIPEPKRGLAYTPVIDQPVGLRHLWLPREPGQRADMAGCAEDIQFPTLSRLFPKGAYVFLVTDATGSRIHPEQCVSDLHWTIVTSPTIL